MKKEILSGLIAIIAIALVAIFAGCIEPTPLSPTPTPSFEIEYPVTVFFTSDISDNQITLYEDGSGFFETPDGNFYGQWEVKERTVSKIEYRFEFPDPKGGTFSAYFALYSNHDAIWDPGSGNVPCNWR